MEALFPLSNKQVPDLSVFTVSTIALWYMYYCVHSMLLVCGNYVGWLK